MSQGRTPGIVLRIRHHGEADKLVTLYSPDLGRVTAIAKGALRSKRRFVNKLEPFSHLNIGFRPPRRSTLYFLSEAELIHGFISLRRSYPAYTVASFQAELVLRFTWEHDADPTVFMLLSWGLHSLDLGAHPLNTAALFHLRLLDAAGYQPQLHRCGLCRQPIDNRRGYQLLMQGHLACSRCHPVQTNPLSYQALQFLLAGRGASLKRLGRLQLSQPARSQALHALVTYSQYLLQQDIRTWKQVRQLLLTT